MGGALAVGHAVFDGICGLGSGGWPCHCPDRSGAFQHTAALRGLGKCCRGSDYGVCGHAKCDFGRSAGPLWGRGVGVLGHDLGVRSNFGCCEPCCRSSPVGQPYQSTTARDIGSTGGICAVWNFVAGSIAISCCYSRLCHFDLLGYVSSSGCIDQR